MSGPGTVKILLRRPQGAQVEVVRGQLIKLEKGVDDLERRIIEISANLSETNG